MKLTLIRSALKARYTIGHLYIDGVYFCDTIEDRDRGLSATMPHDEIMAVKVKSETAIPLGTYKVSMAITSPKFSLKKDYQWCKGRLPRLLGVPGFDGILIHAGRTQNSSAGCIIVGKNKVVGAVVESMDTIRKLWGKLDAAYKRGEEITIQIRRK